MKRNILLRTLCAAALLVCLLVQPLSGISVAAANRTDYNTQFYEISTDHIIASEWVGSRLSYANAADKGVTAHIDSHNTVSVHIGYKKAVKLNGTKIYFDNVSLLDPSKDTDNPPSNPARYDNLNILLSGELEPNGYTGKKGSAGEGVNGYNTLLVINFAEGRVYTCPSGSWTEIIAPNDLLKGLADGQTPFSVQFSGETADTMNVSVVTESGSVTGTMTKKVSFGTSFKDNTDKVYFSVAQHGSLRGIDLDLVAVRDGADTDYVLTDAEYAELMQQTNAAQQVIAAIDALGKVSADAAYGKKLSDIRAAYNALSKEHKLLVNNLSKLEAAETAYATIKVMNTPVNFDEKNIVLKLGAITDTHNTKHFPATFETISNYLGGKPDAIISAGDITDAVVYQGSTAEIAVIKQTYPAVMGDVPYFFCLGNHDSAGGSNAKLFYDSLGDWFYRNDLDKEAARNEANRYMKLGGYHFLAVEGTYSGTGYETSTITWLENKLKAITADKSYKGEYIFIITHSPLRGTVYGSEGDGYTGLITLLKKYPQALVLSGHSHYALADERSIMQTDFTSVHLGAIHYMAMPNQYLETKEPYLLGEQDSYKVSLGTAMEIDKNGNVRITRLDMLKGEQIKTQWLLPAPAKDGSHLLRYTAARADINEAPYFAEGATGVIKKNGNTVQVRFDAASDDDMVFNYVIDVVQNGKVVKTYKSLSRFYNYPDVSNMPGVHHANITGFTYTDCTLRITAVDSWGAESAPLTVSLTASDADIAAARKVDDLIKAIGTVTLDSKAAIDAAAAAYKALSATRKVLVEQYDTLTAAERAYKVLAGLPVPETEKPTTPNKPTTTVPNSPDNSQPDASNPDSSGLPSATDPTDPTDPSDPTDPTDPSDPTVPTSPDGTPDTPDVPGNDGGNADGTPADNTAVTVILIAVAVLVVAGGAVAAVLFLRKRK